MTLSSHKAAALDAVRVRVWIAGTDYRQVGRHATVTVADVDAIITSAASDSFFASQHCKQQIHKTCIYTEWLYAEPEWGFQLSIAIYTRDPLYSLLHSAYLPPLPSELSHLHFHMLSTRCATNTKLLSVRRVHTTFASLLSLNSLPSGFSYP